MIEAFTNRLPSLLLSLPIVLLALSVHETAHGYMAYRLGDPTARNLGRLTLNPLKHLDPMGFLCMVLFRFGWAKPVPVNPRNFRHYKRDMILVALAGPLSNFLMAVVAVAIFRVSLFFVTDYNALFALYLILIDVIASVNISLMVFNLLPIPPLDGSRLWSSLLPGKWAYFLEVNSRYVTMGLFVLLMTGALDVPLALLHNGVFTLLFTVFGF